MSLLIRDATLLDGVAERPKEGQSIWIEAGRIRGVGKLSEFPARTGAQVIDAQGQYVIPGLMNANVHLLCDVRLENLVRHMEQFEDLILEAAQVALRNGMTTVFDTWGPRRFLMNVRDRINAGHAIGSRIFCAGNIIGFDGPFSPDFIGRTTEIASAALTRRINAIWVENVGRHLMWLSPREVAKEVRAYIGRGIDFIKYASNEHFGTSAGAFLAFSPQVQAAMVEAAHQAGITAQAHTTSIEGLRIAVEAGCDLIQHANITGPVAIPEETLELMVRNDTGAVVFPWTRRGFEWIMTHVRDLEREMWRASDVNARNLIRSGARLLMANDGSIVSPERENEPAWKECWGGVPEEDSLGRLATGHFVWLKAMEEKECPPVRMLQAVTRNVAMAYGKDHDLGTIEPGKVADLVILNKNPLQAAANYRSIAAVIKDGVIVDREKLPTKAILTRPPEPPLEEEARYIPFSTSGSKFPTCPMCAWR